jgi:3-isopropylmalate/(R)-2-methylmalate dehydratase small subunit
MTLEPMRGRVAFIFAEDNFDVDRIVGPENIAVQDHDRLAAIAKQRLDEEFATRVRRGDFLLGGANFGYGHPHYPPMQAMRHIGLRAVIAESFAPGYWREEMEEGFPQISCPGILAAAGRWDELIVDFDACEIRNVTRDTRFSFEPFTPGERALLAAGGLNGYLARLAGR